MRSLLARRVAATAAESVAVRATYAMISVVGFPVQRSTSAGSGLPSRRQRYSKRLRDIANSDLNSRCSSMLSRRVSGLERDRRPNERDVREVLIRADADVHAAARARLRQLAGDLQIRRFIRDEVVGI